MKRYFGNEDLGPLFANEVQVGDVVRNEDSRTFQVLKIQWNREGWEEYDLTFTIKDLSYFSQPVYDVHYMNDDVVGVLDLGYSKLALA